MISNQILQKTIDGLNQITKADFTIIDSESSIKVASVAKVRFEEEEDFVEVEEDEAEPQSTEEEV